MQNHVEAAQPDDLNMLNSARPTSLDSGRRLGDQLQTSFKGLISSLEKAEKHLAEAFDRTELEYDILMKSIQLAQTTDILLYGKANLSHSTWEIPPIFNGYYSISKELAVKKWESTQSDCLLLISELFQKLADSGQATTLDAYLCIVNACREKANIKQVGQEVSESVQRLQKTFAFELDSLWMDITQESPMLTGVDILWQAIHCSPSYVQGPDVGQFLDRLRNKLTDPHLVVENECAQFWDGADNAVICISASSPNGMFSQTDVQNVFLGKLLGNEEICGRKLAGRRIQELLDSARHNLRQIDELWPEHSTLDVYRENLENLETTFLGQVARIRADVEASVALLDVNYPKVVSSTEEAYFLDKQTLEICDHLSAFAVMPDSLPEVQASVLDTYNDHCAVSETVIPRRIAKPDYTMQQTLFAELLHDMEGLQHELALFEEVHTYVQSTRSPTTAVAPSGSQVRETRGRIWSQGFQQFAGEDKKELSDDQTDQYSPHKFDEDDEFQEGRANDSSNRVVDDEGENDQVRMEDSYSQQEEGEDGGKQWTMATPNDRINEENSGGDMVGDDEGDEEPLIPPIPVLEILHKVREEVSYSEPEGDGAPALGTPLQVHKNDYDGQEYKGNHPGGAPGGDQPIATTPTVVGTSTFSRKTRPNSSIVWYETFSTDPIPHVPSGAFEELRAGTFFMNYVSTKRQWQVWICGRDMDWKPLEWGQTMADGTRIVITRKQSWLGLVSESSWQQSYSKMRTELIMKPLE